VLATIIVPSSLTGPVMSLCLSRRGEQLEHGFLSGGPGARRGSPGAGGGSPGHGADANSSGGSSTSSSGSNGGSSSGGGSSPGGGSPGGGSPGGGSPGGSGEDRVLLRYQLPLSELAGDFYSRLKTATHGCGALLRGWVGRNGCLNSTQRARAEARPPVPVDPPRNAPPTPQLCQL
jgi:hypothetical protein